MPGVGRSPGDCARPEWRKGQRAGGRPLQAGLRRYRRPDPALPLQAQLRAGPGGCPGGSLCLRPGNAGGGSAACPGSAGSGSPHGNKPHPGGSGQHGAAAAHGGALRGGGQRKQAGGGDGEQERDLPGLLHQVGRWRLRFQPHRRSHRHGSRGVPALFGRTRLRRGKGSLRAGLYDGQTDEGELGIAYREVDAFLTGGQVSAEERAIIARLHGASEHKRRLPRMYGDPR